MQRVHILMILICLGSVLPLYSQTTYAPTMTPSFTGGFGCNEIFAYDRAHAIGFGDCDDSFSGVILFGAGLGYNLYNYVATTFGTAIGDDVIVGEWPEWSGSYYIGNIADYTFPFYSTQFLGPVPRYVASDYHGGVYVSDGTVIAKVSSQDYATILYSFDVSKYGASISGIRANAMGEVYAVGSAGPGFPTTLGAVQSSGVGPIVFRLNAAGTGFVFATYLDPAGSPFVVDAAGAAYLLGNNVVTKLNRKGTSIVYSTTLWSGASTSGIAVDAYGQVYITGMTTGGLPMVHAPQPNIGGAQDGFIAVLNPTGKRIVYSSYLGGAGITGVSGGIAANGVASVIGTDVSYAWDGRSDLCPSSDPNLYAYCSQSDLYEVDFGPFRFAQLPSQLSLKTRVGTVISHKVLLQNLGNVPIRIAGISISGNHFSQANICPATLNPDKACQITISYAPTSIGVDTGALSVTTDAVNSPNVMPIYGTGQ